MDIQLPISSLLPSRTEVRDIESLLSRLRLGQQVTAVVATRIADDVYLLRLPDTGLVFRAQTQRGFNPGEILQLQVTKAGTTPELSLISIPPSTAPASELSPESSALAQAARLFLPRQVDMKGLSSMLLQTLEQFPAATAADATNVLLRGKLEAVLQTIPERLNLVTATGLRQAISDSGIFMESRLATQPPEPEKLLSSDLKTRLLSLVETLQPMLQEAATNITTNESASPLPNRNANSTGQFAPMPDASSAELDLPSPSGQLLENAALTEFLPNAHGKLADSKIGPQSGLEKPAGSASPDTQEATANPGKIPAAPDDPPNLATPFQQLAEILKKAPGLALPEMADDPEQGNDKDPSPPGDRPPPLETGNPNKPNDTRPGSLPLGTHATENHLKDRPVLTTPQQSPMESDDTARTPNSKILAEYAALAKESPQQFATPTHEVAHPLKTLMDQAEGALARIIMDQIASLPRAPGEPMVWQVNLPYREGDHGDVARMKIRKESRSVNAEESVFWSVLMELQPPGLGVVHSRISLVAGQIDTYFWSEDTETAERIGKQLDVYSARLEHAGVPVGFVSLLSTPPPREPDEARNLSVKLVDEQA